MLSLKIVKGAELAEGVVVEMRLPDVLTRFTIGRDPGNHWPIPDKTLAISARHCELVASPQGLSLRDVSTNGTFVNGGSARIPGDHVLRDGDRIHLGPYTILVQGPGLRPAEGSARAPEVAVPAARPPAVEAPPPARPPGPQPSRGGDPAAMLSGGGPARVGLTEILRAAPPAEDSGLEVTKIRQAPRAAPAPAAAGAPARAAAPAPVPAPAPAPPPPAPMAPAPAPVPAAPAPLPARPPQQPAATASNSGAGATASAPLLRHLALGMGLAPGALEGRDAQQLATQVGALARAAVTVLRQLLDQQAQGRRQLGSRAPALQAVRDANPLRLAATPEAALLALLAPAANPEAPLQRTAAELLAHQGRVMAAFRSAAERMGKDMAPGSLEAVLPGDADSEQAARLWQLYTQLWQGMGMAPDQPWSAGFVEAALMHLSAAYDEQVQA